MVLLNIINSFRCDIQQQVQSVGASTAELRAPLHTEARGVACGRR